MPEIDYRSIVLTMPSGLWPVFKRNRHLLHDLPILGAEVIQQWAKANFGVRLLILVVPHTFGENLKFNTHLHILVSQGGLREPDNIWVAGIEFDKEALMKMWRDCVTEFLLEAVKEGVLVFAGTKSNMKIILAKHGSRAFWIIKISPYMPKRHFLQYAGRYARRPPIAQSRLVRFDEKQVVFLTKDRKQELTLPIGTFIVRIANHVQDHYRHNIRYFGLLAPGAKNKTSNTVFSRLNQTKRPAPKPTSWRESVLRCFGRDPLINPLGNPMRWTRWQKPTSPA